MVFIKFLKNYSPWFSLNFLKKSWIIVHGFHRKCEESMDYSHGFHQIFEKIMDYSPWLSSNF